MKCIECKQYNTPVDICLAGGDTSKPDEDIFCREAGDKQEDYQRFPDNTSGQGVPN